MSFQNSLLPLHGLRMTPKKPVNPRKFLGRELPEKILGFSTARKSLTLNSPDWSRIGHACADAAVDTLSPIGAAVGGYFALKAWLSDPRKAEKEILAIMRSSVNRAVDTLVRGQMGQTFAVTAVDEIKTKLFSAVRASLMSIQDETLKAVQAQLQEAVRESGGAPLDADALKAILAPLAASMNSTMQTVVLPAVMRDGKLEQSLINAVSAAVVGAVTDTLKYMVSNVEGMVKEGARAAVASTMFETLDFLKLAMGGVMVASAGYTAAKFVKAFKTHKTDPIRVLESEHRKIVKDTQDQVAALRPELRRRIGDIDRYLERRWFDKRHLDLNPASDREIDEMMIDDLLRIRREYLLYQPDQKKPVELWKTKKGQVQYIKEVADDIRHFPAELKLRIMIMFISVAARSVYPGSSGPLSFDLRGIPGGGKDVLVNLLQKHTRLSRENLIAEPVRMGEGGAGEFLAKTWEFIGQKQFKTSDRQLLGQLGELKLKYGKLIDDWEHGMANGICYVPEAIWSDPTFQQIMKLVLENETNWLYMPSLGVHVWTGDTVFIFSSNEDDYVAPKPPKDNFSDGATRSRFDARLDFTRVTDEARKIAADASHKKALAVLLDPQGTDEMTVTEFEDHEALEADAPTVESAIADHIDEVKRRYASVEKYMLKKHADAMDGARLQFAAQLTTCIAAEILVEQALATIADRESASAKLLEEYVDGAEVTPAALYKHMQTKDPRLNDFRFKAYGITGPVRASLIQYIDDHYDPMVEQKRARQKLRREEIREKQALFDQGEGYRWENRPVPGLRNRPQLDDDDEYADPKGKKNA